MRSGNGEYCLPLPCTTSLGVTHHVHSRSEEDAISKGNEEARVKKSVSNVTRSILADKEWCVLDAFASKFLCKDDSSSTHKASTESRSSVDTRGKPSGVLGKPQPIQDP